MCSINFILKVNMCRIEISMIFLQKLKYIGEMINDLTAMNRYKVMLVAQIPLTLSLSPSVLTGPLDGSCGCIEQINVRLH